MDRINFLSCNVQGFRDHKKHYKFISKFVYPKDRPHPDIIFLQETHSNKKDEKIWIKEFRYNLFFKHSKQQEASLLVAIARHVKYEIHSMVREQDFFLLHCSINGEDYVLVNVHFRPWITPYQKLLQSLWVVIRKFNCLRILIGGDFNSVAQPIDANFIDSETKTKMKFDKEFLHETSLADAWRVQHPDKIRFTHYSKKTGRRLDKFLVSTLLLNYTDCTDIGVAYQTDHAPIYLTLILNRNHRGKGFFRFPDFLTEDEHYSPILIETVEEVVKQVYSDKSDEHKPSRALLWDTVVSSIRGCTIEYLAKTKKRMPESIEIGKQLAGLVTQRDMLLYTDENLDLVEKEIQEKEEELEKVLEKERQFNIIRNRNRLSAFEDTCSKYFFRKVKGVAGALRFMFNKHQELVSTDEEILEICHTFYDNLYSMRNKPSWRMSNFDNPPDKLKLTTEEISLMSQPISKDDLHEALMTMHLNKSPGPDGLMVAFYRKYWNIVGDLLYDAITEGYEMGRFTYSHRLGIIKLLTKPHRDPRQPQNLRPITLLNVGYKLVTKVLALRIRSFLPRLIHTDQNGFVVNRYLGSNVLDVYSLIQIAENSGEDNYALLSLDIYKAFDSINWDFLRTLLHNYGFPDEFLKWIDVMQNNAYVTILNNGHTSELIKLEKGLPQGDNASPFFFILAIETLAHYIREDPNIPGIPFLQETKKVSLVADDSLFTIKGSSQVLDHLTTILNHFSDMSGLSINFDKSTLIALGHSKPQWLFNDGIPFKKIHISEGFKYLGLEIYPTTQQLQTNYRIYEDLIQDVLKSRPIQNTGVSGRILQVKQLVASKFVYLFTLLPPPLVRITNILQKLYVNYVWEYSRHRLNQTILEQPKSMGGLNMVNVQVQNKALRFSWINRLLYDTDDMQFWKIYMWNAFTLPTQDFLRLNIPSRCAKLFYKFPLPPFWKALIEDWFKAHYVDSLCTDNCKVMLGMNSLIAFNAAFVTHVSTADQLRLYQFLMENNVYTVYEFLSNFEDITNIATICCPSLSNVINNMYNLFPTAWKSVTNFPTLHTPTKDHSVQICLQGQGTSKYFRSYLTPPVFNTKVMEKWSTDVGQNIDQEDWEIICHSIKILPSPKLQDFHVQFLNRSYWLNKDVAKFQPMVNRTCTFCTLEDETYIHLFWHCQVTRSLWLALQEFSNDWITSEEPLTIDRSVLSNHSCRLLSVICTILKRYIFVSRCIKQTPCMSQFLEFLLKCRTAHYYRAKARNGLDQYNDFWGPLSSDLVFTEEIRRYKILEDN